MITERRHQVREWIALVILILLVILLLSSTSADVVEGSVDGAPWPVPAPPVFADKLMLHAQTEEQITYPAAILVGEYCKARGWR